MKEHEGDLKNAWHALSEEFEPQTEISLIELLSEFNGNKLTDPKTDVTKWMLMLELQCQQLKAMGHDITDYHSIMHILANLLKEYDVMTMHLYQVLGKKKLTVQKLHTQLRMFYTTSKKANNWGDTDTALNVQNFTPKKSFKGKCSTCRKQGHKVQTLWENRRMLQKLSRISQKMSMRFIFGVPSWLYTILHSVLWRVLQNLKRV